MEAHIGFALINCWRISIGLFYYINSFTMIIWRFADLLKNTIEVFNPMSNCADTNPDSDCTQYCRRNICD